MILILVGLFGLIYLGGVLLVLSLIWKGVFFNALSFSRKSIILLLKINVV